jgi:TorA maturation chaperone TorD
MMFDPAHVRALRLLGRLWVEELRQEDLPQLAALPELADSLGLPGSADLIELAAEHQRLFGFNLPPYESVFLDPSGMLDAPATSRLRTLYHAAGWSPPVGLRAAADDHLGLQLLALADLAAGGKADLAERLLTEHLALWAPLCVAALRRLMPHPFYQALGAISLGTLLNALPSAIIAPELPDLPPPQRYAGSSDGVAARAPETPAWAVPLSPERDPEAADVHADDPFRPVPERSSRPADHGQDLAALVEDLLLPRSAGLFITRRDIAAIAHDLGLGAPAGERRRMLEGLLRGAGGLGLADPALRSLDALLAEEGETLAAWAEAWPAWSAVGGLWRACLDARRKALAEGFPAGVGFINA